MNSSPARAPLVLLLAAVFGLLVLPATPAWSVEVTAMEEDIEHLEKAAKRSKSSNDELRQYIQAVAKAYVEIEPAEGQEPAKFESEAEKARKKARKILQKLVTLVKLDRGGKTNLRDDVNADAARALATLLPAHKEEDRADLAEEISKDLRKTIDKHFRDAKHDVNALVLDTTFETLGKLNDLDTLAWMNDEFHHTNEIEKAYLLAAHKAMVLFKNVPGKQRHAIVDTFITSYAGVETQAERNSNDPKDQAKKRFWDDVKVYAIPVVQYFAQQPTDGETGQAYADMKGLQDWFRDNKRPGRPPWTDPEPGEAPPAEGEAPTEGSHR